MRRIVVVGASLAGWNAATTLRREGFDGTLTMIGGEPERPYDRPPLSKAYLATGDEAKVALHGVATSDELAIEWRLGSDATGLDVAGRTVRLADGGEVPFDGLIIATGAQARTLDSVPAGPGVHLLRTLADARALRADLDRRPGPVAVIGAGFIGAEVAATCRQAGREVAIVEAAPVPLTRSVGAEVGEVCAALHRDHGVDVRLGTAVARHDAEAGVLELTDGSTLSASVVVVGVGVTPCTGWLEGSGLTLGDGVLCDATGLAAPGIVAAGDVARWPNRLYDGEVMRVEHWDNAIDMGSFVARRLLAGEAWDPAAVFEPVPWFWSDQYDRKLQMAGRAAGADCTVVVGGTFEERRVVVLYGRAGRLIGAFGMNRPRQIVQSRGLIARRCSWDEALTVAADWT
ncbi:MAG: FAD-dependent oxidoreductase [Acidimicrobiales bacterium]|nr:FAD-dependent oxidoreductase [Acidimicrobiales bacterium]